MPGPAACRASSELASTTTAQEAHLAAVESERCAALGGSDRELMHASEHTWEPSWRHDCLILGQPFRVLHHHTLLAGALALVLGAFFAAGFLAVGFLAEVVFLAAAEVFSAVGFLAAGCLAADAFLARVGVPLAGASPCRQLACCGNQQLHADDQQKCTVQSGRHWWLLRARLGWAPSLQVAEHLAPQPSGCAAGTDKGPSAQQRWRQGGHATCMLTCRDALPFFEPGTFMPAPAPQNTALQVTKLPSRQAGLASSAGELHSHASLFEDTACDSRHPRQHMCTALMLTPAALALTLAALGVLAAVRLGAVFDAALALVAGALVVLRLPALLAPAAALVSALALAMLTKPRSVLSACECALDRTALYASPGLISCSGHLNLLGACLA